MEKPPGSSCSTALEQFILLSKTAKGAAAAELIRQALETPGIYVFGELLEMPAVKELANGPHSSYYNLLNLFAYGTLSDYKANENDLPPLSQAELKKLRHLTIISLATKNKRLSYSKLLAELDVKNLRELEDLIIDAIYADIIRGKLDQRHQHLEVDFAVGRDIQPDHIREISTVLNSWCSGCEVLVQNLEEQVQKANMRREKQIHVNKETEQEIMNIKKALKATQRQDDEPMAADSHSFDKRKQPKSKATYHRTTSSPAPKTAK